MPKPNNIFLVYEIINTYGVNPNVNSQATFYAYKGERFEIRVSRGAFSF